MIDSNLRRLRVKLQNLVTRGIVDRSGKRYQVSGMGDDVRPEIAHLEPQGLHFRAPAGADGVVLCPAGVSESALLVCAQGAVPGATLAPGEGGLHFLGTYAVYLDAHGKVHLGGGTAAADFVALAALVKARLDTIQTTFDAHTHAVGTTGSATAQTGTAAATLTLIGPLASVAASNVKAT